MDNAQLLDAAAEGTTDNPEHVAIANAAPEPAQPLGAEQRDLLMVSLTDPTRVYGVKDKETFLRVYGENSGFRLVE